MSDWIIVFFVVCAAVLAYIVDKQSVRNMELATK